MTRCYEFYCMYEKAPERCEIESRTVDWQVRKYMKTFKEKGVLFNYNEEDKEKFYDLYDEFGSERAYVRHDEQPRRLVPCAKCNVAPAPIEVKGRYYCSERCAGEAEPTPKLPSQPQRTEKKEYKPSLSWTERKELMHPRVSKMEEAIRLRLQEAGIPFQAQHEFCIVKTTPDFYFPNENLAVYLDGEKVHLKRQDRDENLRLLLKKRHKIEPVAIVYRDNSKKSEDEIFEKIVGAVKGAQ